MAAPLVTVFGGTGFLGRRVVQRALAAGWRVRVVARRPASEGFSGVAGQPELFAGDVRDAGVVADAVSGASAVVNAVSLYFENRRHRFEAIHVSAAGEVAEAAARGDARLVHLSGIGAEPDSASAYIRARGRGEQRVRGACADGVILRPSALFGPGDALLSSLTAMVRGLPVIPLFGDGGSRLQPVHVDDVARAVLSALQDDQTRGMTVELGGPDVYTWRGLLEAIAGRLQRRRRFLPVPYALWNLLAALVSSLPNPPITRDQIALARVDNVAIGSHGFQSLGIERAGLRDILASASR